MLASTRSSRVPSPLSTPRPPALPCSPRRPVPEQTIRAARASDRRKRRSIWRERPPAGWVEERRSGNDALDALRDALLRVRRRRGRIPLRSGACEALDAAVICKRYGIVSQNGNVEGNNPRILL